METGPHPFTKISKARERAADIKHEASREDGVLNPRGLGGPIFDDIKNFLRHLVLVVRTDLTYKKFVV
jgi:hypothetical protein